MQVGRVAQRPASQLPVPETLEIAQVFEGLDALA
jgi:hypothetical protein